MWIFLAAMFVVRLVLANLFPLTADESYYWLWSRHLDWSYIDHPPMIAWINWFLTQGQPNLFMLRLGTVIISTLVSILIYFLAKAVFNEKTAFWSVVLFNLLPHFLIIWLTMFVELPLTLFWTLSLLVLWQALKTRRIAWWLILGVTVGLGLLSKYTMILFWPCLLLFILVSKEDRYWLTRIEPYLAGLISLICLSPVIYWNSRHDWISFTFHATRGSTPFGENFLPFVGDQLVHFTPFFLICFFSAFVPSWLDSFTTKTPRHEGTQRNFLFSFSFPVLFLFLLLSFKAKVWAHWPSIGYIAAIPLAIDYLGEKRAQFFKWVGGFTAILLIVLFFVTPGILLHQRDYAANYQLKDKLPTDLKIFSSSNVTAAQLEFYTGRQTYLAPELFGLAGAWGTAQYKLWGIPIIKPGEQIIYFGPEQKLAGFTSPQTIANLKLFVIEDYIRDRFRFYLATRDLSQDQNRRYQ